MKFCNNCGDEIFTKDGENECQRCDEATRKERKAQRRKAARRDRDSVMRSLGMTKVTGALGGTYWE
jgi:DNA-directed RNA polymerase subunit M/transcription elongation factor TFIIS